MVTLISRANELNYCAVTETKNVRNFERQRRWFRNYVHLLFMIQVRKAKNASFVAVVYLLEQDGARPSIVFQALGCRFNPPRYLKVGGYRLQRHQKYEYFFLILSRILRWRILEQTTVGASFKKPTPRHELAFWGNKSVVLVGRGVTLNRATKQPRHSIHTCYSSK